MTLRQRWYWFMFYTPWRMRRRILELEKQLQVFAFPSAAIFQHSDGNKIDLLAGDFLVVNSKSPDTVPVQYWMNVGDKTVGNAGTLERIQ